MRRSKTDGEGRGKIVYLAKVTVVLLRAWLQQAGRWKSVAMVNRYGERLLARKSGAAQLARLQRRG